MPLPKDNKRYTYEEWVAMDEDVRAELIDGELFMMATPSIRHQRVSGNIFAALHNFLKGKPCQVFAAPIGVRLNESEDTVFEPDIIVICDKSKLDGKICNGSPDMVIEILSPSTARHDRIIKFEAYRRAGVKEYWIVDPETGTAQICILKDGLYFVAGYTDTDIAPVVVLPGCEINLHDMFAED